MKVFGSRGKPNCSLLRRSKDRLHYILHCLVPEYEYEKYSDHRKAFMHLELICHHFDFLTFTFGRLGPFLDTVYVENLEALLAVEHGVLRPNVL